MQVWCEKACLLAAEPWLRLGVFVVIFLLMLIWECRQPARVLLVGRYYRCGNNLALVAINALVVRVCMPLLPVTVAVYATQHGVGLLTMMELPASIAIIVSLVFMDLILYLQHRLFHRIPWLWRLHRVHHSDQDVDVTTGLRFHPLEIVLSLLIKMLVVLLMGIPVVAVIVFEIILSSMAIFNHANIRLPHRFESWLRRLLVTPDMHRIHHSVDLRETHSNFGFNLSCWDRWLGSYSLSARQPLMIGVCGFRRLSEQRMDKLLTQPFRQTGSAPDE